MMNTIVAVVITLLIFAAPCLAADEPDALPLPLSYNCNEGSVRINIYERDGRIVGRISNRIESGQYSGQYYSCPLSNGNASFNYYGGNAGGTFKHYNVFSLHGVWDTCSMGTLVVMTFPPPLTLEMHKTARVAIIDSNSLVVKEQLSCGLPTKTDKASK